MAEQTHNERPPHGWTCFHCGETFTTIGLARVHFGAMPDAEPGCMIKVRLGAERGLLMALREAEKEAGEARFLLCQEASEAATSFRAMQGRHAKQLMAAEEAGYERGLADGRALRREG